MTIRTKRGDTRTWAWSVNTDLTNCASLVGMLRQTPLKYHQTVFLELHILDRATGAIAYTPDGTLPAGVHYLEVEMIMADGTKMTAPTEAYERVIIEEDLGDAPPVPPPPLQPNPVNAAVDTQVTITGTGLDTVTAITLTGWNLGDVLLTLNVPIDSQDATELVFTFPASAIPDTAYYSVLAWTADLTGSGGESSYPFGYEFPRAAAKQGYCYAGAPEIIASDAASAAKLTGLGFVADPPTPWAEGEYIGISPEPAGQVVNSYRFHWDGTDWQPGVAEASTPTGPLQPNPVDAAVDTQVTITGTNLDTVTEVVLHYTLDTDSQDFTTLTPDSVSPTQLVFTIPAFMGLDVTASIVVAAWAAQFTTVDGPQSLPFAYEYRRDAAKPGYIYCGVAEVTAQDEANAALLSGLGFAPVDSTAWAIGEFIVLHPEPAGAPANFSTLNFLWNGTAWTPIPAPTFTAFVPDTVPINNQPSTVHLVGANLLSSMISQVDLMYGGPGESISLLQIDPTAENTETDLTLTGTATSGLYLPGTYLVSIQALATLSVWRDSGLTLTMAEEQVVGPPTFTSITPNLVDVDGTTKLHFTIAGMNFLTVNFDDDASNYPDVYDPDTDNEYRLTYVSITDTLLTLESALSFSKTATWNITLPAGGGANYYQPGTITTV